MPYPSPAAASELEKYRTEIDIEPIPLTEEHGVQFVDVVVNGEPLKMVFDSGESLVLLPARWRRSSGPQDPTIQMSLADGHVIQVIANVTCAVMAKGLTAAPAVLGQFIPLAFRREIRAEGGQASSRGSGRGEEAGIGE